MVAAAGPDAFLLDLTAVHVTDPAADGCPSYAPNPLPVREGAALGRDLVPVQHVDGDYVLRLVGTSASEVGHLLKDRIVAVDQFVAALHRVACGEAVVDKRLVADRVRGHGFGRRLAALTSREREVLALMAEGLTDRGIAARLVVTARTAEAHAQAIFRKLDLPVGPNDNRRVHAVLTYLRATANTHTVPDAVQRELSHRPGQIRRRHADRHRTGLGRVPNSK